MNTAAVPLTPAQRAMLAATVRDPVDPPYVLQVAIQLDRQVSQSRWRTAWDLVVAEHPILRLRYGTSLFSTEPLSTPAAIEPPVSVAGINQPPIWNSIDLCEAVDFDRQSTELLAEIRRKGLVADDHHGTPLSQSWWIQGRRHHLWCLMVHHAVVDGNSFVPLFHRLVEAYNQCRPTPHACSVDFLEYARRQTLRDWSVARQQFDHLAESDESADDLRECFHRTSSKRRLDQAIRIPVRFATSVRRQFVGGGEYSRASTVYASWAVLLSRLLDRAEVILGVTRHCRTTSDLREMIGPVANILPLAVSLEKCRNVGQLLEHVQEQWQALAEIETCPLREIASSPGLAGSGGPFQSIVNVCVRCPEEEIADSLGALCTARPLFTQRTDIPVALTVYYEPEPSAFLTAVNGSFSAGQLKSLADTLAIVMEQVLAHGPDLPLEKITLSNQSSLVHAPLGCTASSPLDQIGSIAHRFADTIAVSDIQCRWTFASLWSRAGAHAAALEAGGIEPEDVVAILTGRSVETIAAMLGILRQGGAFFVVSEDLPLKQRGEVIDHAGAKFIVADEGAELPPLSRPITRVDVIDGRTPRTEHRPEPQSLAYLVATSGTTGRPKVVMNTHGGLNNLVSGYAAVLKPTPDDVRLQAAAAGSDTFVLEVMLYLSHGARLHLDNQALQRSMPEFNARITEAGITVVGLPSSVWREWARSCAPDSTPEGGSQLRAVICSMERTSPEELRTWREQAGRNLLWINAYGPSEAACVATLFPLPPGAPTPEDEIPIGRPLHNTTIHVVDAQRRLRPNLVVGEIAIGGVGVGRGYRNDPVATTEKFVADPYQPGGKLYLTGDLGYMTADGQLVFVGRKDHQVKVRGNRIELEEVDLALQGHPDVTDAAAVAVEVDQYKQLIGFYEADRPLGTAVLKSHLRDRLPGYAIPHRLLRCESIPRSQTGKVQRRDLEEEALRIIEAPHHSEFAAPQAAVVDSVTALAEQLQKLFEVVLHQPVLTDDEFFEIGGDSLNAVRLLTEIESRLQMKVTVGELIQNPTPHRLARSCCERSAHDDQTLIPLRSGTGVPLLFCHGAAGNTFVYQRILENVDVPNPVWAVHALDRTSRNPRDSFADMCKRYAAEFKDRCESNRVILCGYSLGGLVAFETAQHLHSRGVSVDNVIILDTRPVNLPPLVHWKMHWRYLIHRLGVHARQILARPYGERLAFLYGRAGAFRQIVAKGGVPRAQIPPDEQKNGNQQISYTRLIESHPLLPHPVKVTLIRSSREHRNPVPAWKHLSCGNLQTFAISCWHHELPESAAPDVGRLITKSLGPSEVTCIP